MKGEKIYVVVEESAYDGLHDLDVTVFDSEEDAFEHFENRKAAHKEGLELSGWKETDSRYSWESWADGYYDENHVVINVTRQEIL